MKLASLRVDRRATWGVVEDDTVLDVGEMLAGRLPDLRSALAAQAYAEIAEAAAHAPRRPLARAIFDPVIPNPGKILCVGHNYESHRQETNRDATEHPSIFTRFADSQVGHGRPLVRPRVSTMLDFEGELAVVIGRGGRRIPQARTLEHVAGYACYMDASVRDWQWHTRQFTPGKTFPGTGGFGPWLTTADAVGDPSTLSVTTRVNGEVMQSQPTANMIFPIPVIIAYVLHLHAPGGRRRDRHRHAGRGGLQAQAAGVAGPGRHGGGRHPGRGPPAPRRRRRSLTGMDAKVVVVGAGPTGLVAANLLGRYGVRALLVDRNAATVQEPRAVSIDDESLRTLQGFGAAETVLTQVVGGYGSDYFTPSGRLFLKVAPQAAPYGYPRRNAFRQPVLEAQLRDHLGAFPDVATLFGWTVDDLAEDDGGVSLQLCGPGGVAHQVRCAYVVAADGASSSIRKRLGLALEGETFSERWLIVDLEDSPAPSRNTQVFCDVRRPCIALPGPHDTRRFEFKLVPGDDAARMTDTAAVEQLLRSHGAAPGGRVRRKVVYSFHARMARRWSQGRVFLAGDACHLTPPFAGQGMNSGLRDAHNLAWKLAAVVRGELAAAVLDSYEAERRPHAEEMIRLALRMGRIMGPPSRLAGFATQSAFRALGAWPAARDYFGQMNYKPKLRFASGLLLPDGRPRRRTSVGRLLPQPWVKTTRGRERLDNRLGEGWALLGFCAPAALDRAAETPALAALRPAKVAVGDGPIDGSTAVVVDVDGELRANLDAPDGRVFLVRPDRYVLGAFDSAEAAVFGQRLAELLVGARPQHRVSPASARIAAAVTAS